MSVNWTANSYSSFIRQKPQEVLYLMRKSSTEIIYTVTYTPAE
jgi:hypothetical protein